MKEEKQGREILQCMGETEADDISIAKVILDRNDSRFEVIEDKVVSIDSGDDGYILYNEAIIKRLSDGKFFKVLYEDEDYTTTWKYPILEVFPAEQLTTIYI